MCLHMCTSGCGVGRCLCMCAFLGVHGSVCVYTPMPWVCTPGEVPGQTELRGTQFWAVPVGVSVPPAAAALHRSSHSFMSGAQCPPLPNIPLVPLAAHPVMLLQHPCSQTGAPLGSGGCKGRFGDILPGLLLLSPVWVLWPHLVSVSSFFLDWASPSQLHAWEWHFRVVQLQPGASLALPLPDGQN